MTSLKFILVYYYYKFCIKGYFIKDPNRIFLITKIKIKNTKLLFTIF